MDISVIIPVYNSANSIERCLESVLNQTAKVDYQIIIVNDGSVDSSVDIVKRFIEDKRVNNIEIINKPNGGVSSARNIGIKASKGTFIALLDSDDEWLPEKIERQLAVFNANPNIDFLGCNVTSWTAGMFGIKKKELTKIKIWEQFISWYPATSTSIFRRSIINDVGYYDENMTHAEDGHFLIRILMKKNCWFMPDKLVVFDGAKSTSEHSGLSSDINAMQKGQYRILKYAYESKMINKMQYMLFWTYSILKHWRRLVIVKLR